MRRCGWDTHATVLSLQSQITLSFLTLWCFDCIIGLPEGWWQYRPQGPCHVSSEANLVQCVDSWLITEPSAVCWLVSYHTATHTDTQDIYTHKSCRKGYTVCVFIYCITVKHTWLEESFRVVKLHPNKISTGKWIANLQKVNKGLIALQT